MNFVLYPKEKIKMSFLRKAACVAVLLSIAVSVYCSSCVVNVSAANIIKGTVKADALNVRKGPGKENSIINVIYEGDSVEMTSSKDGWYKIKQGKNKYGWVSADFVKTSKKATADSKDGKKANETSKKSNENTNGTITVTGSYTNLRKGAGSGYAVIKKLYCGTVGSILEKSGSWYRIKMSDSKIGWVSKKYVKVTGYKDQSASISKSDRIIVTSSSVNVRSTSSTSGKLVATIRHNEVYKYSEVKNGWYKIITPSGETGYVSGKYVDEFKEYAVNGGGKYIWPTQTATRITTYFGTHNGKTHNGIDIAAPGGAQIIAVADGKVYKKSYNPDGFGHLLIIEQNDGIRAYYAHMQKESFLSKGDNVKAGDTIGVVGTTGKSTGNHLHLEFRKGDKRIDPFDYYPDLG